MNECKQYLPDLCAWLDGELEDSRALEAHLAHCASCRALAAQYRTLDTWMAEVTPPADLHQQIMSGISKTHSPKAKRRFAFGATAVAATAAALLLAVGMGMIALPRWDANTTGSTDLASAEVAEDLSLASTAEAPAASDTAESAKSATQSVERDTAADMDEVTTDTSAVVVEEPAEYAVDTEEAATDGAALDDSLTEELCGYPTTSDFAMLEDDDSELPEAAEPADVPADPDPTDAAEETTDSASDSESFSLTVTFEDNEAEVILGDSVTGGTNAITDGAGTAFDELLASAEERLAAGEQLVWIIYTDSLEDLPEVLQTLDFLPDDSGRWVASVDSEYLLEFYLTYGDQLSGTLSWLDDGTLTGTIIIDPS